MNSAIPTEDSQRLYHDLARLFKIISPPSDYVEECEAYARILRRHARIPLKTLLNLGCGAGHHDHALKKCFTVTGADIADEMLSLARELNPEAEYVPGDMRTLELNRAFDTVTIFDSGMYMLTETDIRAAFATTFRHLKPGGVCIAVLDVTRESFIQNRTYCTTHDCHSMEVTYVENYYDPDPSDTQMECTMLFLIRRNGELSIETDRHICGLFSLPTWVGALADAGFEVHTEEYTESGFDRLTYPVLVGVRPE